MTTTVISAQNLGATRRRASVDAVRWVIALLGAGGVVTLLVMTRWGIGTSPDSVAYIRAARHLAGGQAVDMILGRGAEHLALTHFAPLYSFLLAAGALLGLDPFDWARWFAALLFGLNILVVGTLVRRSVVHAPWLSVIAALLMLGSVPVLSIHTVALSEPVFMFLTFTGLGLLTRFVEQQQRAHLVLGAVALGLALLARYAGVAGVLTGAIALLLLRTDSFVRRVRDAFVFGLVSCLPMLIWILRNTATSQSATGRELMFHPIDRSHLWQAVYTFSDWLLIPAAIPGRARIVLGLAFVTGLGALLLLSRRERPGADGLHEGPATPHHALVTTVTLFAGTYVAFLLVSLSWFDANTPLDGRILAPLGIAGIIVMCYVIDRLWPMARRHAVLALIVLGSVLGFSAAHLLQGVQLIAASHARGWGFSSVAWRESALWASVRALPDDVFIVSNVPEAVYLHTGRQAEGIPKTWLSMERRPNTAYPEEIARLGERLHAEKGVVVYFTTVMTPTHVPSVRDSARLLDLQTIVETADGSVLCSC